MQTTTTKNPNKQETTTNKTKQNNNNNNNKNTNPEMESRRNDRLGCLHSFADVQPYTDIKFYLRDSEININK